MKLDAGIINKNLKADIVSATANNYKLYQNKF